MTLLDIATLIVYVVGTVLHIVLSTEILHRPHKRRSEVLLLFVGMAAAMWFLGNALGKLWGVVFQAEIPIVTMITKIICCLGVGFIPSLLMHMAFMFWVEHGLKVRRVFRWIVGILFYIPAGVFSYALFNLLAGGEKLLQVGRSVSGTVFIIWLALALAVSAGIELLQSRRAEDDYERRFHLIIFGGVLLLSAAIAAFAFILALKRLSGLSDDIVDVVDFFITVASLLPAIVLSYYVYRYNYMELVLRRSVFHGFLTILVISLYYYPISRFGRLLKTWSQAERFQINVELVEAMLIIALVYLFPKISELLRRVIVKIAFRQTADTEEMLASVNRQIAADMSFNMAQLTKAAAIGIRRATGVRHAAILFFPTQGPAIALPVVTIAKKSANTPVSGIEPAAMDRIIDLCRQEDVIFLDRHECKDVGCVSQMREVRAERVFPIRGPSELKGLICLGRAPGGFPLDSEVCDMLVQTAHRLSGALEHAKLIQERIDLERTMLESEKFSSLGRLSAGIAHEVKNPLSSIKTLAQLLQEDIGSNKALHDDLQLIIDEVDRLARVVTQLLRFARPPISEGGESNITSVLDMVLQIINPEARASSVEIRCRIQADIPPVLIAEDPLKEVLFNVIYNGIQAMPDGGVLDIGATREGARVEIRIADTGTGIPEDVRARIFDPFFTTKISGTGLGLSIAKRRIEEAAGSIRTETSSDGTVFIIAIPVEEKPSPVLPEPAVTD